MKTQLLAIALVLAAAPCFAQRPILKGATDQTTYIRIIDSADGTAETGVTSATGGLDLEYVRLGAAPVDLTESDLAATDSAHSDGGIKHVGGGRYRVDLPDAACASSAGVNEVAVQGVCTGMIVIPATYPLVAYDPYDAVRLGLTALPNVASGNAGAVLTAGTGTAQLSVTSGRAAADVTHFNGTAGVIAAGRPQVEVYTPKVWYVDASAGSDSNDGRTPATAKLTTSFISASTATGDTIYFADGSYTNTTNPKSGQTWIGSGWAAIITRSSSISAPINFGTVDSITLRNLKIENTNSSGKALLTTGVANRCVIEGCWVTGPFDGGRLDGFHNGIIRNCRFDSDYDALIVNGRNVLVENCLGVTTASKDLAANAPMRCFGTSYGGSDPGQKVTFRNCQALIAKSVVEDGAAVGFESDADCDVTIEGGSVWCQSTHASDTGNAHAVIARGTSEMTINGLMCYSANAGSGQARDLVQLDTALLRVNTATSRFDSSKTTGTITAVLPNVAPAASGGLATVDASNNVNVAATALRTALGLASADLDTQLDGIADDIGDVVVSPIATTYANKARTWLPGVDGSKAANVVTVKAGAEGTFSAKMALNEGADIEDVVSVTVTDPEDDPVVATNLRKTADGLQANFDLPELTVAGDYVVVVTVETIDDATIPMECKLTVRP